MKDFFEENKVDWTTIEDYEREGTLSGFCMALAECDKLLSYILTAQSYQGDTIYKKIHQAKTRFSDLSGLAKALEIKENIFSEYDKEVSKEDIKKAIKHYRQAIVDLTESDKSDLALGTKIKAWINYYLDYRPGFFKKLVIWFLVILVILFVFDATHPGQAIVHFLVNLFVKSGKWLITSGIVIGALIVIVLGVIVYFEKKNKK